MNKKVSSTQIDLVVPAQRNPSPLEQPKIQAAHGIPQNTELHHRCVLIINPFASPFPFVSSNLHVLLETLHG